MIELSEFQRTCDEKHLSDRGRISKLEDILPKIFETLDKYKTRPTWVIAGVITFLSSALGITITALIQVLR